MTNGKSMLHRQTHLVPYGSVCEVAPQGEVTEAIGLELSRQANSRPKSLAVGCK